MASITFVEGKWRALIRRKGYPDKSKRFDTKAKAANWARDIEGQIITGKLVPTVVGTATIGSLITKYIALRAISRPILDTSTEHYTLKQLSRLIGNRVASELTVEDMLGWAQARRDEGAGPYTINCDLSKLGTVLRYTDGALLPLLATVRPKLSYLGLIGGGGKRERRPTEEELALILDWLGKHKGKQYQDYVAFAVMTAMRRGEVSALKWDNLDHDKKMILVQDRKDPREKKGNDQWVPLLGHSWELVLQQPKTEDRIFPIHPQTVTKYFTECCKELGIPDLHLHDMRHEGISQMFELGYAIQQVAIVSGHKDWRHLKRYTQIKPESLHSLAANQDKLQGPGSQRNASHHPHTSSP